MLGRKFTRWVFGLVGGGILLQTASCTDQVTAIATSVTAGGVLYIIRRIIE